MAATVRERLITAAGALLLAIMGCAMNGQQPATKVDWDLTQSHAKAAIHWPDDSNAYEVRNADATIRLPGGRTYRGQGVHIIVAATGGQIDILDIELLRTTIDDGYPRARALARQWNLRTDLIESWYKDVQAGRARGVKDQNERFPVYMAGDPLAPGGPIPFGKVLFSFDDAQPFLLDLQFQWT